jgi:hypothetical protein
LRAFTGDAQLIKQFRDNKSFCRWLTDTVFGRIVQVIEEVPLPKAERKQK